MSTLVPRRTLVAAAAATVLAVAIAPLAVSRADSLASVDVYDRVAGQALPVYRHHGRKYVEGQPGNEYAVRIRNCTGQRILAVLSVDGVNAVTGETASPDQSGYVIEPYDYVTVQGWRKDLDRTAAFYFSGPGDSYAARTGRPKDLGVIGVALFRERALEPQPWSGDMRSEASEAPAPSNKAAESAANRQGALDSRAAGTTAPAPAAQSPSLGTGHGRGEYSPAVRVEFERASSQPDELVAIRYERHEKLVAMGVLPRPWRHTWRDPDPFPGQMGFVPDP
jgi:hypothetical protein